MVQPEMVAPSKFTFTSVAPVMVLPVRTEFERLAPVRFELEKLTELSVREERFWPERSAPVKLTERPTINPLTIEYPEVMEAGVPVNPPD